MSDAVTDDKGPPRGIAEGQGRGQAVQQSARKGNPPFILGTIGAPIELVKTINVTIRSSKDVEDCWIIEGGSGNAVGVDTIAIRGSSVMGSATITFAGIARQAERLPSRHLQLHATPPPRPVPDVAEPAGVSKCLGLTHCLAWLLSGRA